MCADVSMQSSAGLFPYHVTTYLSSILVFLYQSVGSFSPPRILVSEKRFSNNTSYQMQSRDFVGRSHSGYSCWQLSVPSKHWSGPLGQSISSVVFRSPRSPVSSLGLWLCWTIVLIAIETFCLSFLTSFRLYCPLFTTADHYWEGRVFSLLTVMVVFINFLGFGQVHIIFQLSDCSS